MKVKGAVTSLLLGGALAALPSCAQAAESTGHVSGQYIESRTADVYTGPCFANSEVNLTGQEAVLAWHVDKGTWGNVSLDGLSVAAVVRASATLGDPFNNPLPAKAVLIVDQRANRAQRQALVNFAQAQGGELLSTVVATEAMPIRFTVDASKHGTASLQVGDVAQIATRAIVDTDEICHNEDVYYEPLVSHLTHAMPAVASRSSYSGNHLGSSWNESNRRSAFIASFAV
ncbi:MAG TPA: DUF1326 domain-containing protein [Candidatus Dormibacteraeota bacterium]|nr:DUF1326 domain-containing protein [Candidatus Dormibacteraeota bacterium]